MVIISPEFTNSDELTRLEFTFTSFFLKHCIIFEYEISGKREDTALLAAALFPS